MKTGCVPIFKITRDLAYILSLGMTTELVHDIDKPLSFLKSVRRSFTIYLKSILNIQKVTVTSSVFSGEFNMCRKHHLAKWYNIKH